MSDDGTLIGKETRGRVLVIVVVVVVVVALTILTNQLSFREPPLVFFSCFCNDGGAT